RADKVVVVSEYWKNVMEKAGCSDVEVIYNSFDLELFRFNSSELQSLKQRLNLSEHKPLIYLGNARPDKGFLDSYQSLKDLEATFVATGKNEHSDQLPVRTFYLSYKNYLRILKLSTLAITMSVFDEGWCRTAHEAMLCGTPVVGSGRGGMQELLEKGGQVICQDFSLLDRVVKSLLSDKKKRDEMSRKGREFASRFNLDYFREKFLALVSF
ncbi:MAG: glycosyltransferase family 4 protein, partial [Candidatus Aminicenantales bacterium]